MCTINQTKVLTLDEAFEFHKSLAREKGIRFVKLDMAEKNDFTENKPKENSDQALISIMNIIIDIVRLQ